MPETPPPFVSIITVCLNAEAHLARAMDSVYAQAYPNIEYVVIDGASTDGTVDIIRHNAPRFEGRMRWVSEPDKGLYHAMNKGVAMAEGDLIGILNADDYYLPGAIESLVSEWLRGQPTDVIYGDLLTVDGAGVERALRAPDHVGVRELKKEMIVYHPSTFVPAQAYSELGGFDTSLRIAADYDFLLRCAESGYTFRRVKAVLAAFSLLGVSMREFRETDRESTLVRIRHGVPPAIAWARFYKRIVTSALHRLLTRSAIGRSAYTRYKS